MQPIALGLIGIAVLMLILGIGVLRKQSRAQSCPAHSQVAGKLATVIAWMLITGSGGLIVYAWGLFANQ